MADYVVVYVAGVNLQAVQGPNANHSWTAASGDLANGLAAVSLGQAGKYVAFPLLGAVQASFTTNVGINNSELTYTALAAGNGGNSIRFRYVLAGINTALSVSVSGTDITINLATNGTGVATSTANAIQAAIIASSPASALVAVTKPTGNDGTGIPNVGLGFFNLASGTNGGCVADLITLSQAANETPTTF